MRFTIVFSLSVKTITNDRYKWLLNIKGMVREKESTKGIEFHEIKMNELES